jgi:hypothetical protein
MEKNEHNYEELAIDFETTNEHYIFEFRLPHDTLCIAFYRRHPPPRRNDHSSVLTML